MIHLRPTRSPTKPQMNCPRKANSMFGPEHAPPSKTVNQREGENRSFTMP